VSARGRISGKAGTWENADHSEGGAVTVWETCQGRDLKAGGKKIKACVLWKGDPAKLALGDPRLLGNREGRSRRPPPRIRDREKVLGMKSSEM